MGELRPGEINDLVPGDTSSKRKNQDFNTGNVTPEPLLLITMLLSHVNIIIKTSFIVCL